jgi:FkbM family methyltransferase
LRIFNVPPNFVSFVVTPPLKRVVKEKSAQALLRAWPMLWPAIRSANSVLPATGRVRQAFADLAFNRPWSRWYKSAYESDYRDIFFEYILTFFYRYPIRRGDVVVHIGASFGEEIKRFVKAVGRKGRVFAIEPEARNVEVMRALLPPRPWPQLTIIQSAAAREPGEIDFFVGGGKEHRIVDIPGRLTYEWWGVEDHLDPHRYQRVVKVAANSLDNILRPYGLDRIDFILVETNGSELEAVQGMDEVLKITRRLGVRGHVMRDGVPICNAIADFLRQKGFKVSLTSEQMVLAEAGE